MNSRILISLIRIFFVQQRTRTFSPVWFEDVCTHCLPMYTRIACLCFINLCEINQSAVYRLVVSQLRKPSYVL